MLRWTLLLLISMCLCFLGNTKKSGIAGSWIIHIQKFNGCCQICPPKKKNLYQFAHPREWNSLVVLAIISSFIFANLRRKKVIVLFCISLISGEAEWASFHNVDCSVSISLHSQLSVHHSWTCGSPSYGKILSYYIGYKYFCSICSLFSRLLYGILHFEK